ncbi:MAG: hypothetical protein BA863_01785 [Desulfovibrio sp. S3730MH75]|nr:MAG: hypothetical protein BA863_01785 [Desulfovibrio sp. S3730MH75]
MHKLIVNGQQVKDRALHIVGNLDIDDPCEIVIGKHKKNRSADQNSLLWSWYTIIGAALGESKDAVHERSKEKFLVPIYTRDEPDFTEMIASVRDVYRAGMKDEATLLFRNIVKMTSTTTATVPQMTEYLQEIEAEANGFGIYLPHEPEMR